MRPVTHAEVPAGAAAEAARPNRRPIGVFDSGVGGLTVARTMLTQLPQESMIYIGDTKHTPYGSRPIGEVRRLARDIADELVLRRGCKALVIACNTASSAFLHDARERYDIPVIEVIRPAVRRAVATTRNGRIGVIGTAGTIGSGAYQDLFSVIPNVVVTAAACPKFVDFVEQGITSGREVLDLAEGYLAPLKAAGVDTLVLGCTHYPLLSGVIQLVMGDNVSLITSSEEATKDVLRALVDRDLLADPQRDGPARYTFEATGDPVRFAAMARRFLGPELAEVHPTDIRWSDQWGGARK